MFGIGNIIASFNKLQKQVDAYNQAQFKEVQRLESLAAQAKADQAKGEGIAKALKAISSGE